MGRSRGSGTQSTVAANDGVDATAAPLRVDGGYSYSHPQETYGDVFLSIVLAVYATADMAPEPHLAVVTRS